jgi:phosphatidate cytidylyltransferase
MLRTRMMTAIGLLAVMLPGIFWASSWVWGVLSLGAVTVAAFEWGRLVRGGVTPWLAATVTAVFGAFWLGIHATLHASFLDPLASAVMVVSVLFWVLLAPLSLWRGQRLGGEPWWWGLVLLLGAWVALLALRERGPWMLLSCMALVWCADIGAYAVGRRFGRHKLAPRVSPGKTWEGVVGAIGFVGLVVALAFVQGGTVDGVFSNVLIKQIGVGSATVLVVLTVALSIVGDLYESLLKRLAGVKDSGSVLPGHGGVLDRVDALLPTMPWCCLLLKWVA